MKVPGWETVQRVPPAFISLAIVLLSRQVIDPENSVHVWIARGLFAISQLSCIGVLVYLYFQARENKDPATVTVKEDIGFGQEGDKTEKITIGEHDQRAALKDIQKVTLGLVVSSFIHVYWGFIPPLVIGVYNGPQALLQMPIVRVLLRGEKAWGKLQRPWAEPVAAFGKRFEAWNDTITSAFTADNNPNKKPKKEKKEKKKRF
ncbi:hypothetical protein H310_14822 [Aphanomyces invadans]|uniref:Inorganic phosphate transporter Pho88 n=1 Tax=Aphanomyces invadans TaxID=157072 RepID=A0A024T8H7_9STRA|nr:hypothetical protein H310_14822 [Aphanomyces invadans]ETV90395.1 hypothetical protein H310_14822 [Aphanomyces invadans]|eukprot:XP_008880977.1 hypothetical protein H310_14822 [Aphanomyces invadans]